ncbi:copia protein [Trichonephila clavipes]|nr:copia protein [Trichonephila clavipes]
MRPIRGNGRECRNGTAASSGTSNRRSRTYRKGPELRQHPSVSSPIGSSVTSDEFNYNSFRGGRRDRNYSFKDRNELSRYHGSANSVVHQNQERGIKHEKTNIYTPQQNGASERLNRTVIDGARTVLSESGLDKSFWPEAVLYFVHVWNRLCHSGQTLTPIELYIGIKPSIRHLRPFGSTLYVGTPRPLRGKLDPKAKKGILVGFALGTRGYRKPQQSNGGAVLASPNLKFSDYEVFENGDDDTDEDERVHNIPISLPQDSDSKTEGENLSRTEKFHSSCKNYMETCSDSTS